MYMYMCMHTHTYMCMREAAAATAGCCVHLMRLTGRVIVRGLIVTRRAAVLGATAEQQQQQRHARGRGVEPVKTHGAREEDVGRLAHILKAERRTQYIAIYRIR